MVASTDWRILCTHYPFNFGSVAGVDRKLIASRGRTERIQLRGLADGGGRRKRKTVEKRLRVKSARGEEALNRNCAEKCRGGDVRVRVEVRRAPWRRRMRAGGGPRTRWGELVRKACRQKCAVSALGEEEKVIARESVLREKECKRAGGSAQ